MKIEEGKYYRRADGKNVGPAVFDSKDILGFPFNIPTESVPEHWYREDGTSCTDDPSMHIVSEWTDRPPLNTYIEWDGSDEPPVPDGTDVTVWAWSEAARYTLEGSSFRDVTAYLVHSYPPEEERVRCFRSTIWDSDSEGGTCIIRNGVVDWSTWKAKP